MKNTNVFILAGGKSSRMGAEKGLTMLNEKSFIQHIIDVVLLTGLPINIISNSDSYNSLPYPVFNDLVKDKGPLGGIYSALVHSDKEYNLILSCDIPFINEELINYLIENSSKEEICTVPTHNGNIEPLCAIYKKGTETQIKELIDSDKLGVQKALSIIGVNFLDVTSRKFYSETLFLNINSMDELREIDKKTLL